MKRAREESTTKRSPKKKSVLSEGLPKRPPSAYNFFFKQERPLLLQRHKEGVETPDFDENLADAIKAGKEKETGALFQAASRTLGT